MSTPASALRVHHVSKTYAKAGQIVTDVSFTVQPGEFVFLVGRSGAGKSTLLKLLSMAERLTSGDIEIAGFSSATIRPRDIPALRRRLGIVFQDFRLLPDRTAEANIAFALEVTGAPRKTIGPKVSRLLTQVGLATKGGLYPHELSGGEQQRVAIARALVNDPQVILADEPTGNLDEKATSAIYRLLQDVSDTGTTVIMATHDVALIERTGRRFIELAHGTLVCDGTDIARLKADMRGGGRE